MVANRNKPVVLQGKDSTPAIPFHDKNKMKDRMQDNTSCLQRSRKRRDPPAGENSTHPGMSPADFNYLSIPSLFGGQPAPSRFESSIHDCMIESGAYVSYIAEAMDPTPRLDPDGALGGAKASSPADEEIDFVDENTVTDKSDDAFIRAHMHRIENNETIHKRPPDQVGPLNLNVERPSVKQAMGSIVKQEAARQQTGPLSCTPRSSKTPKVANLGLTSPLKCFGGDPGSPNSTTTGGGNTDENSQGGSLKASDSDSIDGPQQLDCKIKDHELSYSPARRVGRRIQTPRRARSRSKSKAPRLRQSPRRKAIYTPSIDFTSTIESASLKSHAEPPQYDETGEHIEVIFVEEQFRKNELFHFGESDGAVFSSPPDQPNPADNPLHQDGSRWYERDKSTESPSDLKYLRKKSIMNGMTTEEESTVRLDERDSNNPRRMVSPLQNRQPASPMVQTVDETQVDDSGSDQNPLEYSQSETTDQKNLGSQASVGEGSQVNHSRTGGDTESKHNRTFQLNASTDDALGALSGRSFVDASITTNGSLLASSKSQSQGRSVNPKPSSDLPNATDGTNLSVKSSTDHTLTTKGSLVEVYRTQGLSNTERQRRYLDVPTPPAINNKSEFLLDLEIARSNEVPESDAAKEQISRDMFTVKSDANRSKGSSRKDPRTSDRVNSIMALVDCDALLGDGAKQTSSCSESNPRYPAFFVPFQHEEKIEKRGLSSRRLDKSDAFFVPFNPSYDDGNESNMQGSHRQRNETAPLILSKAESRGQDISELVEKHNMLRSIHKKTQPAIDTREINSIIADSHESGDGAVHGAEGEEGRTTNPTPTAIAKKEEKYLHDKLQIKPTDSRLAVCESVPSSLQSGKSIQGSLNVGFEKSRGAVCQYIPSSLLSEKPSLDASVVETVRSSNNGCNSAPLQQTELSGSIAGSAKPGEKPLENTENSDHRSSSGSHVEGYFTCLDKDESICGQASKKFEQATTNVKAQASSKRGRALSPLTIEKSIATKDSKCGFDSLGGGPPRMIEIIQEDIGQEDESSATDKSIQLSMIPLKPNEPQSQLDSVQSTIGTSPSAA
eukprot:scaffold5558_cov162-Amphora_coffeaeformis.AAC.2